MLALLQGSICGPICLGQHVRQIDVDIHVIREVGVRPVRVLGGLFSHTALGPLQVALVRSFFNLTPDAAPVCG